MNPNQERLVRYLRRLGWGHWGILGEDATPDARDLEQQEIVEINEAGNRFRLVTPQVFKICWYGEEEDELILSFLCFFENDDPGSADKQSTVFLDPNLSVTLQDIELETPLGVYRSKVFRIGEDGRPEDEPVSGDETHSPGFTPC